jgi:alkylation response protein AidB-like acyl-CoA dehydrogenase
MDFDLSEEQRLLKDMVGKFVAGRYGFELRAAAMRAPGGFSRTVWREMAELGLLGLPFTPEDGGFGGGGVEQMIVMEALGSALVVEPYFATVILAGGALRLAGSPTQKESRIGAIIAGERIMALAHHEPGGPRHTVGRLSTKATRAGAGWRLSGAKTSVIAGAAADELVVSASGDGGVSLFLVEPSIQGVVATLRTGFDGTALADITFEGVELPPDALLGAPGSGDGALTALFEEANAALCAEAVGVMADLLDTTVEYLKTRTQFGVPIGSFQALQHCAADMLMQVELARSMAILAALSLDRAPEERWRNIAAAKAKIGQAGRFVGQQAVQLHGAIGLTEELKVGHAFKRLTAIDLLFGDADYHIDALAEAGGLTPIG